MGVQKPDPSALSSDARRTGTGIRRDFARSESLSIAKTLQKPNAAFACLRYAFFLELCESRKKFLTLLF